MKRGCVALLSANWVAEGVAGSQSKISIAASGGYCDQEAC